MTAAEFQALKDKVDDLQRQESQALGALEQLSKQLLEEFGCKDLKEAEGQLKALETELAKLERRLARERAAFDAKWKEMLDG